VSLSVRIKKNFGSFSLDVEFEAPDGVMGLLGASGCGKSMTLKCVAGVISPDEGRIVADGRVLFDSAKKINLPPQHRRVGLLFQNYALFPNMTVERNIMSALAIRGKRNLRGRFAELAEKFYIRGLENHYPANLSGGQQQRVALARIMASEPTVLMLDEPLSALDSYLRWQLEGELSSILDEFEGTTMYVSHNRDEVYRLCEKVCIMNSGMTEVVRSVKQLFESPNTLSSSLLSGCKNYSRVKRITRRLVHAVDWNVDLTCREDVEDDICYIGVRAHYLSPSDDDGEQNAFPCRVIRIIQDVFHTIINLVPIGAPVDRDFSRVRMELSREASRSIRTGDIISVKVKPEDVMLLKK
jgi:molybdate transport system ATP-binding protein